MNSLQKLSPYRNKRLLAAAEGESCVLCKTPAVCAHHYKGAFQHQYGGGIGVKVSDFVTMYVCQYHHDLFHLLVDSGKHTRLELEVMQLHAVILTNIRRLRQGILK